MTRQEFDEKKLALHASYKEREKEFSLQFVALELWHKKKREFAERFDEATRDYLCRIADLGYERRVRALQERKDEEYHIYRCEIDKLNKSIV